MNITKVLSESWRDAAAHVVYVNDAGFTLLAEKGDQKLEWYLIMFDIYYCTGRVTTKNILILS